MCCLYAIINFLVIELRSSVSFKRKKKSNFDCGAVFNHHFAGIDADIHFFGQENGEAFA